MCHGQWLQMGSCDFFRTAILHERPPIGCNLLRLLKGFARLFCVFSRLEFSFLWTLQKMGPMPLLMILDDLNCSWPGRLWRLWKGDYSRFLFGSKQIPPEEWGDGKQCVQISLPRTTLEARLPMCWKSLQRIASGVLRQAMQHGRTSKNLRCCHLVENWDASKSLTLSYFTIWSNKNLKKTPYRFAG